MFSTHSEANSELGEDCNEATPFTESQYETKSQHLSLSPNFLSHNTSHHSIVLENLNNVTDRRTSNLSQFNNSDGYPDNISMLSGVSGIGLRNLSLFYNSPPPYLVLSRLEKLPLKDFSSEVRASLDIEKFVKESVLFLEMPCLSMEEIIERMLINILECEITDEISLEMWIKEAKTKLFMHTSFLTYSYQRLAKTIKGISIDDTEGLAMDQSWITAMATLPNLHKRHLAIARLSTPANLGRSNENVHFIILVLNPTKEKGTKSEIELGRTFSTIMADIDFRQQLLMIENEQDFRSMLQFQARQLAETQKILRKRSVKVDEVMDQAFSVKTKFWIGGGIVGDIKRRIPHYLSDYCDGFKGANTIRKVFSTTSFLYFSCLLPSIAFGVLNGNNTDRKIDVKRVIISQAIGGLVFGILGGQPLIVMLTTAPLALYTKIIFTISTEYKIDFSAMFACTGIFNAVYLMIYSLTDMCKLMKWSTKSTEEVFAFFVAIAFTVDASKDVYKEFAQHYQCAEENKVNNSIFKSLSNMSNPFQITSTLSPMPDFHNSLHKGHSPCHRDVSVLYLLLTIGTVWLAGHLFNFTKTPYLNARKRELLADFALPLAITIMSIIGALLFRDINLDPFYYDEKVFQFQPVNLPILGWKAILSCAALGFPLSLLFFMDQNIASSMVNSPSNKLKKGSTFHWDLFIVALINGFLSIFGLPWIHGAIPHSPLHVKALSDIEERIDIGHKVHQTIVRVRETRVTSILSNIFIALSLFLLPKPLSYIPIAVLDGLFIHMAVTSLYNNQFCERITLLFTEQSAYPPSHYLRRVPQRKLHLFTFFQLIQLIMLSALGFSPSPYMKMGFPIVLLLQIPIRHKIIPKFIDEIFINAMDKSS
uniref:Slc4a-5 n=1 Tax=Schmidtea mediterranea TaxID=79327 RepID=A0A0H3YIT6_SCHMD|nr:slc4a-5 [Schmidtea mediterranea]